MLKTLKKIDIRSNIVYVGVVVVFILFALMLSGRGFTSTVNLLNILRQSSIIIVMAMAMTFVIGAAEIDLSVGSIAGLASVATAMAIARSEFFPASSLVFSSACCAVSSTVCSSPGRKSHPSWSPSQ